MHTEKLTPLGNLVLLDIVETPRLEVKGKTHAEYKVRFIDNDNGLCHYETVIETDHWCQVNIRYYVNWLITVTENDVAVFEYVLNLKGQDVLVILESNALGDNVAWTAAIDEFRKAHDCKVTAVTHWNAIFVGAYPEIRFAPPGNLPVKFSVVYRVGCYDGDYFRNKNHWRVVPLQKIATDCLGLEYRCVQPKIVRSKKPRPIKEPYVAISEFAAGYLAKEWLNPGGWQAVVNQVKALGYQVMSVSKEPTKLEGVIKMNDRPIAETIRNIQHAEFYIGVSSGLCVVAWALGVPSVVIAGLTEPWGEMQHERVFRVINTSVCHGCLNDLSAVLDRGNYRFCPRDKNFICTRAIEPSMVMEVVERARNFGKEPVVEEVEYTDPNRVVLVMPHCSTGGGPRYWLECVQHLKSMGRDVAVVEYNDYGDLYVVHKHKIKELCQPFYYTLGKDKNELRRIVEEFLPAVVHVQECPENFLSVEMGQWLYRNPRPYKIIETFHTSQFTVEERKYWPDAFAFVSDLHFKVFSKAANERKIPMTKAEMILPKRVRPDRTKALTDLKLDPSKLHVLNVGLFTQYKNQGEIWQIAKMLPYIQFHFVGNQAANFQDYWAPLMEDKPANCTVWGEREDVDAFYSAMDLFLFTSILECFPICVKEALSWGMPVLMRNLEAYCGAYNNTPSVTFINDDLRKTCELIKAALPSMAHSLHKLYENLH